MIGPVEHGPDPPEGTEVPCGPWLAQDLYSDWWLISDMPRPVFKLLAVLHPCC